MKKLFYLIIFIAITSCSNNKVVYWCGDHQCINKKEKESYFQKTMIVEVKELSKKKPKKSLHEKITQQVNTDEKNVTKEEKKLAKQIDLDEQKRMKEEKELAKQIELDEQKRMKEEKELAKQIEFDKKEIVKKRTETPKQDVNISSTYGNIIVDSNKFKKLVEKVTNKNSLRPYPNINDIPN